MAAGRTPRSRTPEPQQPATACRAPASETTRGRGTGQTAGGPGDARKRAPDRGTRSNAAKGTGEPHERRRAATPTGLPRSREQSAGPVHRRERIRRRMTRNGGVSHANEMTGRREASKNRTGASAHRQGYRTARETPERDCPGTAPPDGTARPANAEGTYGTRNLMRVARPNLSRVAVSRPAGDDG